MVQHRLRHRRGRVITRSANASATTTGEAFVSAHADVCVGFVTEGASSSQFLLVIFNQNCGGCVRKCVCLVLSLA